MIAPRLLMDQTILQFIASTVWKDSSLSRDHLKQAMGWDLRPQMSRATAMILDYGLAKQLSSSCEMIWHIEDAVMRTI